MSLESELLAHQAATLKLGANAGKSVNPYLDQMRSIIRKRVSGFDSDKRTAARLTAMLDKLANELFKPSAEWVKEIEAELKTFAKYESAYQAETIGDWVKVDLTTPAFSQVWAAAKFNPVGVGAAAQDFGKMISDWPSDEVARLVMGVKSGFVDGLPVKQIIKNVVGAGGLSDVSARNAMTIANTGVAHVANTARYETLKENDDVVEGFTIVVTLDGRTSAYCRSIDETKVHKFDGKTPLPPYHPNCRDSISPVLSSAYDIFDEGATRAANMADGGQTVSDKTGYYDLLSKQPAAYQDEVLGKTKGMIFRNSGLSAEEFRKITVDDLGRPLTIEQMAARDKRVASYLRKSDN